jgi:Arc/MetJ family transcription regulator
MDLTGLKTKKAAVEAGLRLLVQINEQQAIRRLRGKVTWSGNLDEMRAARNQDH